MHITSQYLANEEKAMVATSKAEALEVKASRLRRDLIAMMDANNASKEKIKTLSKQLSVEKLLVKQKDKQLTVVSQKKKNAVTKAIHAFQLTNEYNAILFGWQFKGFELLRRYLVKHCPGIDLEDLDFEAINKKIEANEAAQASQAAAVASDNLPEFEKYGNDVPTTQFTSFFSHFFFYLMPYLF